jgi:hypothetical protein
VAVEVAIKELVVRVVERQAFQETSTLASVVPKLQVELVAIR